MTGMILEKRQLDHQWIDEPFRTFALPKNNYREIIWIKPQDGNWKISNIEMIDEERLL